MKASAAIKTNIRSIQSGLALSDGDRIMALREEMEVAEK